jgi:hypothetical protein
LVKNSGSLTFVQVGTIVVLNKGQTHNYRSIDVSHSLDRLREDAI